jgi:4-amino-4-deoxy-L-arabinose transferase-like glycosyltransferase
VQARILTLLSVVLLLIGYFAFNGVMNLRAEEPRRAVVGLEAYKSGEYLVPQLHGRPYCNKPPVYNWVLAMTFSVFESYEPEIVRLPGTLSIWLTALLIFFLTKRYTSRREGLYAALIYLTLGDLLFYGAVNSGEIDLFYSLIVVMQVSAIFHFAEKDRPFPLFLLSYLLAALGLLTKGLPSLAFQVLTLVGYFIYRRKFLKLFSFAHLLGILSFVAVVGGYFFIYELRGDAGAFMVNLWNESSSKSANESGFMDLIRSLATFPFQLLQITLPWSLFLILPATYGRENRTSLFRFSLVFFLANIALYWIAPDVRNRYLYMFFPFLAIVAAAGIRTIEKSKKRSHIFSVGATLISIIAAIGFTVLPFLKPFSSSEASGLGYFLFALVFFLMAGLKWKLNLPTTLYAVMLLAVLRLAYNVCILPVQAADSKSKYYASHVDQMLAITRSKPIHWVGKEVTVRPTVQVGGTILAEEEFRVPPPLAYQIPYRYTLRTGELLLYTDSIRPRGWCLGDSAQVREGEIYHAFRDKWTGRTLALYKINQPPSE